MSCRVCSQAVLEWPEYVLECANTGPIMVLERCQLCQHRPETGVIELCANTQSTVRIQSLGPDSGASWGRAHARYGRVCVCGRVADPPGERGITVHTWILGSTGAGHYRPPVRCRRGLEARRPTTADRRVGGGCAVGRRHLSTQAPYLSAYMSRASVATTVHLRTLLLIAYFIQPKS